MTDVTLRSLSKTYPNAHAAAVHNLSMAMPSGQITALLGPSGCGKTTVLKMIAGLIDPSAGDILFAGQPVNRIPAERRGAVMVFQNHLLFPYMSVGDNVGFGLKMRGEKEAIIRDKVQAMLELVQLPGLESRRPKQLSGGQQQRVALARALIVAPQVLLLDEPLSNLDAHLRGEMRDLILDIQRKTAITTIFVTHDQEEAMLMADQIALIFDGQLQQFARPRTFYEQPNSERVARFFGGVNFISGMITGHQIETPLGMFACDTSHVAPGASGAMGAATLTIRPENLQLYATPQTEQPNQIAATIESHIYLGTHVRFQVAAQNHRFEVVSPAEAVDQFAPGQAVQLQFPPEKTWLLPA